MNTAFIIDDDKHLRHCIRERLEQDGFFVMEASHGSRMMDILLAHKVSVIVQNMHLPDGNSLALLPQIRHLSDAPIIVMSEDAATNRKVEALVQGVHDYMTKPVDIDELVARVHCHLGHHMAMIQKYSGQHSNGATERVLTFWGWTLDAKQYQALDSQRQSAQLTMTEYKLLHCLVSQAGAAVSRDELCLAAQQDNYIPAARAIDIKITRIRKKIGDHAQQPRIIKTIRGVGYMVSKTDA